MNAASEARVMLAVGVILLPLCVACALTQLWFLFDAIFAGSFSVGLTIGAVMSGALSMVLFRKVRESKQTLARIGAGPPEDSTLR